MRANATMPPRPTVYSVRARALGEGRATAEVGTERIRFDASWGPTKQPGLPGPADLLAAALAACLIKNVERCSSLMPFTYDSAEVIVTAYRQDRPPRFTRLEYRLDLITDEPARRVALLHDNLRRYGTVYNTLAAACEIEGDVRVAAPARS